MVICQRWAGHPHWTKPLVFAFMLARINSRKLCTSPGPRGTCWAPMGHLLGWLAWDTEKSLSWDQTNASQPGPWTHFLITGRAYEMPTPRSQQLSLQSFTVLSLDAAVHVRGSPSPPCMRVAGADSPVCPQALVPRGWEFRSWRYTALEELCRAPRRQVQQRRGSPGRHPKSLRGRRSSSNYV